MRRLAWTFAARIGGKYQIRLTRFVYILFQRFYILQLPVSFIYPAAGINFQMYGKKKYFNYQKMNS